VVIASASSLVSSPASSTRAAALNKGEYAAVSSGSCGSAGNCAAGGSYTDDGSGHYQAFVASERNGTWHAATELPGTSTLNKGGSAGVASVSCALAGGQLRGRRVLLGPLRSPPGVRGQPDLTERRRAHAPRVQFAGRQMRHSATSGWPAVGSRVRTTGGERPISWRNAVRMISGPCRWLGWN